MVEKHPLTAKSTLENLEKYVQLCDGMHPFLYFFTLRILHIEKLTTLHQNIQYLFHIWEGSLEHDESRYLIFYHFKLLSVKRLSDILLSVWKSISSLAWLEMSASSHLANSVFQRLLTSYLIFFNAAILFLVKRAESSPLKGAWVQMLPTGKVEDTLKLLRVMCAHILRALTSNKDLGKAQAGKLLGIYACVTSTAQFLRTSSDQGPKHKEALNLADEVASWMSRALDSLYRSLSQDEKVSSLINAIRARTGPILRAWAFSKTPNRDEMMEYGNVLVCAYIQFSEKGQQKLAHFQRDPSRFALLLLKCVESVRNTDNSKDTCAQVDNVILLCNVLIMLRSGDVPRQLVVKSIETAALMIKRCTKVHRSVRAMLKNIILHLTPMLHKSSMSSTARDLLLMKARYDEPSKAHVNSLACRNRKETYVSIERITTLLRDADRDAADKLKCIDIILAWASISLRDIHKAVYAKLSGMGEEEEPIFWKFTYESYEETQPKTQMPVVDVLADTIIELSKSPSAHIRAQIAHMLPVKHLCEALDEIRDKTLAENDTIALEKIFWIAGDIIGSYDCTTGELAASLPSDLLRLREALHPHSTSLTKRKHASETETPYSLKKALRYYRARAPFKFD